MASFLRFFSRRRTGRGVRRGDQTQGYEKPNKKNIICKVLLLDGTDVTIEVPVCPLVTFSSSHLI